MMTMTLMGRMGFFPSKLSKFGLLSMHTSIGCHDGDRIAVVTCKQAFRRPFILNLYDMTITCVSVSHICERLTVDLPAHRYSDGTVIPCLRRVYTRVLLRPLIILHFLRCNSIGRIIYLHNLNVLLPHIPLQMLLNITLRILLKKS